MGRMIERWQGLVDHPIVRLELRRIRRKRWWPGRRFFMFYPALLGAALGYGVILALSDSQAVQLATLLTAVPAVCLLSLVAGLLGLALPWIVPALTAASIVRERELGTFDLLRATLLTERSIVLGKLGGCLARLWPGILVLALLAPFQLVWVGGTGLTSYLPAFTLDAGPGVLEIWVWLFLAFVAGLLRPWGDLALHAAVGLFISLLARSSAMAVAISYSAVIVIRLTLWLVTSILSAALMAIPGVTTGISETMVSGVLAVPLLILLGRVLVEFAGAALLVCAATWWLRRA